MCERMGFAVSDLQSAVFPNHIQTNGIELRDDGIVAAIVEHQDIAFTRQTARDHVGVVKHAPRLSAEGALELGKLQPKLGELRVLGIVRPQLPHHIAGLVIDNINSVVVIVHNEIARMKTLIALIKPFVRPEPGQAVAAQSGRAVRVRPARRAQGVTDIVSGIPCPGNLLVVGEDYLEVIGIDRGGSPLGGFQSAHGAAGDIGTEQGIALRIGILAGRVIPRGLGPAYKIVMLLHRAYLDGFPCFGIFALLFRASVV